MTRKLIALQCARARCVPLGCIASIGVAFVRNAIEWPIVNVSDCWLIVANRLMATAPLNLITG